MWWNDDGMKWRAYAIWSREVRILIRKLQAMTFLASTTEKDWNKTFTEATKTIWCENEGRNEKIMQSRRTKISQCPWNILIVLTMRGWKGWRWWNLRPEQIEILAMDSNRWRWDAAETSFIAMKGSLKIQEKLLKSHWVLCIAQVRETMWKKPCENCENSIKSFKTWLFLPEKFLIGGFLLNGWTELVL